MIDWSLLILCQCRGLIDKTDNWGKHTVIFFFIFFIFFFFAVSKRIKNSVACVAKHLVADPNLELRGGGGKGSVFVACPAGFSSVCGSFFFFLPKVRGGGAGPTGPSPRSATNTHERSFKNKNPQDNFLNERFLCI